MTVQTDVELIEIVPDSKVHGANIGPIWGRKDPSGPNVGPMNFAIWGMILWNLSEFAMSGFMKITPPDCCVWVIL